MRILLISTIFETWIWLHFSNTTLRTELNLCRNLPDPAPHFTYPPPLFTFFRDSPNMFTFVCYNPLPPNSPPSTPPPSFSSATTPKPILATHLRAWHLYIHLYIKNSQIKHGVRGSIKYIYFSHFRCYRFINPHHAKTKECMWI